MRSHGKSVDETVWLGKLVFFCRVLFGLIFFMTVKQ